jgi:hypothetical protein
MPSGDEASGNIIRIHILRCLTAKKFLSRTARSVIRWSEKLNRPGERKAGSGLKLRNNPMNLLGIMPAKEGGKKVKRKKVKGKTRIN